IMIEADDLCRTFLYHKHKLILILASMRQYAEGLQKDGRNVIYRQLKRKSNHNEELGRIITQNNIEKLVWMKASDRSPNYKLKSLVDNLSIRAEVLNNEQFLLSPAEFDEWFERQKQPLMENFYRWHRKKSGMLVEDGQPVGGSWNYDRENRKPLPRSGIKVPTLPGIKKSAAVEEVQKLVDANFVQNPGLASDFWLPTTREDAVDWLVSFIDQRLPNFGAYEDAMKDGEVFYFTRSYRLL
ncbi:MAG: cryptochrome/photolyase family protein, partial [Candidatus Saccharimonadales bacterium]|nr:cryptochrome/photolyase family protein [Candidatus Saccharimonadales bacterium]